MDEVKTFEARVWEEIINAGAGGSWVDGAIEGAKERPDDPIADSGPILERMLALGVTREEIGRLGRQFSYEACFSLLYLMDEVDLDPQTIGGLHALRYPVGLAEGADAQALPAAGARGRGASVPSG